MFKGKRIVFTSVCIAAFITMIISGILIQIKPEIELSHRIFEFLSSKGQFIGLAFILFTLKFKPIVKDKILITGVIIGIISIVMKLLHLQWSELVLILSVAIVIFGTILRFVKIEKKTILDYLKIVWFPIFLLGIVFKIMHLSGARVLLMISSFLVWLLIINYIYIFENKKSISRNN